MKDIQKKVVIMVTGTLIEPYDKNWRECEATWIPELRNLGYRVISVVGNPDITDKKSLEHIKNYYKFINENLIQFETFDTKLGLYDKSINLPIRWILDETDYEYYFRIDSDSFVNPHTFDKMLIDNLSNYPNLNYMGCCHPYRSWNPEIPHKEWIFDEYHFAAGAGYMISRKAMKIAKEKMRIEQPNDFEIDDWVLGRAMWENGIPLLHDSRILFESPHRILTEGEGNIPYVGDSNSGIAIQHYMDGNMEKAMVDLKIRDLEVKPKVFIDWRKFVK
jgi:hypothetical protein